MCDKRFDRSQHPTSLIVVILIVSISFIGSSRLLGDTYEFAFRPGPQVPGGFKPKPGVDASNMDISDSTFVGMDLGGANFQGSNLQRVRFVQVALRSGGVAFQNANLRNAAFIESPHGPFKGGFKDCDFTNAVINGLTFSDQQDHLSLDQIQSTRSYKMKDLSGCQIVGGENKRKSYSYRDLCVRPVQMDFTGFDLRDAVFVAGDFRKSEFRASILAGAVFFRCRIRPEQIVSTAKLRPVTDGYGVTGAQYANRVLEYAYPRSARDFSGIGFSDMKLSAWDFREADLRRTRFCRVDLTGVDFTNADIRGAHFFESISKDQLSTTRSYRDGALMGIVFVRLDLSAMDFSLQNLARASFVLCDLKDANFTDAIVTGADFSRCIRNPPTIEQIKSTWNYKHGRMTGVELPLDLAHALKQEKEQKP